MRASSTLFCFFFFFFFFSPRSYSVPPSALERESEGRERERGNGNGGLEEMDFFVFVNGARAVGRSHGQGTNGRLCR